jgi:hypothetical protein
MNPLDAREAQRIHVGLSAAWWWPDNNISASFAGAMMKKDFDALKLWVAETW